ncbi:hypothetical protein D3C85_1385310 [compost metagenome]
METAEPFVVVLVPASAFSQSTLVAGVPTPAGPVCPIEVNAVKISDGNKESVLFIHYANLLFYGIVMERENDPAKLNQNPDLESYKTPLMSQLGD